MIAPIPALGDIAGDPRIPTPYDDVTLLRAYENKGHDPVDVRHMSLAVFGGLPHPGLVTTVSSLPAHAHGYMLTPRGWPDLVDTLRPYITTSHRLGGVAELGADYDVASCSGHTRSVMPDFGRLLIEENEAGRHGSPLRGLRALVRGRTPVAVVPGPGWDYAGAFTPVGYKMRTYPVHRQAAYQPDVREVTEVLARARRETAGPVLFVINAQHNPSASNWAPEAVRGMIRAALAIDASVLIDDAYFGVVDPGIVPTSALAILLEELAGLDPVSRPRWLAVRSLGKQFACNGWGVGAQTAAPDTLRLLGERLTWRTYPGGPLELAMAAWLKDPDSQRYVDHHNQQLARKRAAAAQLLADELGYPPHAYFVGECTAFMLIDVPPWLAEEGLNYRQVSLNRAGVLIGEAHMSSPGRPLKAQGGRARLFVGAPEEVVTGALKALASAGLTWRRPSWR